MNTCRTCKHAQIVDDLSICHRVKWKFQGKEPAFITLQGAILLTEPDNFGCILHEPITPETETT